MASSKHDPQVVSSSVDPVPTPDASRPSRAAAIVFALYLAGAFLYVVLWLDVGVWFAGDEWAFLAARGLDADDLLTPLQTHWSTLPILVYHGLYSIFGLESYTPYLVSVLLLHLTLCVLLRVVMRRTGVSPWLSTVAAGTFVLFGPGHQNIVLGVQISMVGSMVLGYAQLLAADHDGPIGRRDGIGVVAGILGLMCSGIGPVLILAVGVSTLLRRGWRAAAFHTAPAGLIYLIWSSAYGGPDEMSPTVPSPPVRAYWDWMWNGEAGVFAELGSLPILGFVLLGSTVVGLWVLVAGSSFADLRRRASMPTGLLCGALVLFAAAASQRWIFGEEFARSSRYLSMGAAFTLPMVALGLESVISRWRIATVPVFCLLLVGIPASIGDLRGAELMSGFQADQRRILTAAAHAPYAEDVPPDLEPEPSNPGGADVTMDFLLDARAEGRLPPPPDGSPELDAEVRVRLGLDQRPGRADAVYCPQLEGPITVETRPGDRFVLSGAIDVSPVHDGQVLGRPVRFDSRYEGSELVVVLPDLDLMVEPVAGLAGSRVCR